MTVPTDTKARRDRSASAGDALRRVLLVDSLTSGGVGLLLLAAAAPLSDLWGLTALFLRIAGITMVLWGVGLGQLVRQGAVSDSAVRVVVIANWAWFAASVGLLLGTWVEPRAFGSGFIVCQALIVACFAALQGRFLALRRVG
ncbi:MAG TPA: hypothetical protein VM848_16675 [Acidimicrobiia bacterium]|nr:hypothetical protein [Acidimicrobiia bacterium]